ncbi:MAG TPA: PQQ-binding-like beta-propeller repeat protein, partial [Anaerolineales bacterium]|nr:PQQ-binding-like beta-propeller repeat protein [Anaerolineales bacterium]
MRTASPPTAVTEATVLPAFNALLYRGGTGRTGKFNVPRMEAAVEVQWQQEVGPSVHGSPLLVGNTLLVPTVTRRFVALDATSGEEKWIFEASGDLFSSPAVMDEVVYIGNENGNLYALDLDTGSELWSLELGSGIWTAPLVLDENVYVGSQTGSVYAVNTKT